MRLLIGLAALAGTVTPPGALFVISARSAKAQERTDTRQAVRLEPVERNALMVEMRTMLQSITRILHGLAAGDSAMVESASRTSGMASALSPQLQEKLPAHFVQLDSKTHRRFDELANASVRTDKTLVGLAMITGYCASCHDTYRLEETR
jgi:cytochrome c556